VQRETAVLVASRPDGPVVGLDDRAADGQSHPQPLRLAGHEALEDSLELGCGDADAAVTNRDGDLACVGLADGDPDLARAILGRGDGFSCVDDQVQEDLSERPRRLAEWPGSAAAG
jgi:hypothetical protein